MVKNLEESLANNPGGKQNFSFISFHVLYLFQQIFHNWINIHVCSFVFIVRANKAMRRAIDNLKVGVESFGEKNRGEEMERARMKQMTQSLIQTNELNMRDLNIRLTAVYEELNEYVSRVWKSVCD